MGVDPEASAQDELQQAAAVMCDALGMEEGRPAHSKGRGKGVERRSGNESPSVKIARAFFTAATVKSGNDEDILPQEDGTDEKLSVYYLFSELFPDHVNNKDVSEAGSGSKNGLTRLQFNKLGYEIYLKEQSRRVPAPRAKPGNPGYGFKHARWRSPKQVQEDAKVCVEILMPFVKDQVRLDHIMHRIDDFRIMWNACRRPSHPAGPGRGRKTSSNAIAERKRAFEQVRPFHEARANMAFSGAGSPPSASTTPPLSSMQQQPKQQQSPKQQQQQSKQQQKQSQKQQHSKQQHKPKQEEEEEEEEESLSKASTSEGVHLRALDQMARMHDSIERARQRQRFSDPPESSSSGSSSSLPPCSVPPPLALTSGLPWHGAGQGVAPQHLLSTQGATAAAGRGQPTPQHAPAHPGVLPLAGSHVRTQSFNPQLPGAQLGIHEMLHPPFVAGGIPLGAGLLLGLKEDRGSSYDSSRLKPPRATCFT